VNKLLLMTVLGVGLGLGSMQAAEVIVRVGPPRAIVERRPVRPGRRYIWIGGYHRWDGRAYAWVPGRWELPPREHAVWVGPRWEHRHEGYAFREGYWR
jgi:hypothetical protein